MINGSRVSFSKGVPKGSPLSPALFNIFMEDFILSLYMRLGSHIESAIYSDDLVLLFEEYLTNDVLDNLDGMENEF